MNNVMIGAVKPTATKAQIPYRVVWFDPFDKKFGGKEYYKNLADAKASLRDFKDDGFEGKIEKGNYDKIYYGDRRKQI